MPTIEERALATAVEAAGRRMQDYRVMAEENILRRSIEAHALAIETLDAERAAHAQFRQEVSDAVEAWRSAKFVGVKDELIRFIVAKPDPLAAAKAYVLGSNPFSVEVALIDDFLAACTKHGLRLVEVGDAD